MEQERDAQGLYIDPITMESIPEKMQVLVNGLYLSLDTLYMSYAKTGKLEDPFTRSKLEEEIEKQVLTYIESRKVLVQYAHSQDVKEYSHVHCAKLGEVLLKIIYEDEAFTSRDLRCAGHSILETDLYQEVESFAGKKLLIASGGKMTEKGKNNLLTYLHKDGSGMAMVVAERIGGRPAINPQVAMFAQMMGVTPEMIQNVVPTQGGFAIQIAVPFGGQHGDANNFNAAVPDLDYDWDLIENSLEGIPEEDVFSFLEGGINPRATDPKEFYVSLLGDAGMRSSRLLQHICAEGGESFRHNLLSVLWFGRGLRCTEHSLPYLAAIKLQNARAAHNRLELLRNYFARHGVSNNLDETRVAQPVRDLMQSMR